MTRLKIKYKSNLVLRGSNVYVPDHSVYVGRVVSPRPSWLSKDEFLFTTGDIDSPVRILDKKNIIEAWVSHKNIDDGVTLVPGEKRPYVVTRGPFGRYSCNCTAYGYRQRCSHTDGVKRGS